MKILDQYSGDLYNNNPISFSGGFSQVRPMKFMERDVVVKTMKKAQSLSLLLQEYILLKKLNFEGVPSVYGLFYSYEIDNVCLIIQNVEKKKIDVHYSNLFTNTVNKFLVREQKDMEDFPFFRHLAKFVEQFCFIISNIHRAEVSHCDLSPNNIIINEGAGDDFKIWIIDFGSALDCQQLMRDLMSLTTTNSRAKRNRLMFRSKGTPGFQAPQLFLQNFPRQNPKLTKKTDIYSFGLIVYFLIFRKKLSDQIQKKKGSILDESFVFNAIKQQFDDLERKLRNKQNDRIKQIESYNAQKKTKDKIKVDNQVDVIDENIKLLPKFMEFLNKTLRNQAKNRPSAIELWAWIKDSGMIPPQNKAQDDILMVG